MRIRTIKPEFFLHIQLFEAESDTKLPLRVAFAGLWCAADREGRFVWEPQRLKVQILPYDEVDFSRVLDALVTRGFILKYASGTREFGVIPSFKRHQIINNRERYSEIPSPSELIGNEDIDACPTRAPRVLDGNTTLKSGREGKGREQGTCVQGSENTHTNGKLLEDFKTQLSAEFKRKPQIVWPRLEEEALVQICRRPEAKEEYRELLDYRKVNPAYFPRSIGSLLEGWDKTLDQARSFVKTDANGHPQKSLLEKIADEDLARIKREFGGGSK